MSKFFEAASKLNPNLVESVLSNAPQTTHAMPTASAAPPLPPPAPPQPRVEQGIVESVATHTKLVLHAGEFSIAGCPASPALPFQGDTEDAAEGYKLLRTKILQHPRNPRFVCVSSAMTGDGKSITAINIAGVLALKENTRVLLLDCDLRHPTIQTLLGLPEGCVGTAEVLAGKLAWHQAILRCKEFPNLYVAPAGQSHGRAAELLDSAAWRSGCQHVRTVFDYVVVDSPPIGMVADYDLIQEWCDGVVIVARPNHTDRGSFNKMVQSIAPEKNLGVVLNCVERWRLWQAPHDYRYAYAERSSERSAHRRN